MLVAAVNWVRGGGQPVAVLGNVKLNKGHVFLPSSWVSRPVVLPRAWHASLHLTGLNQHHVWPFGKAENPSDDGPPALNAGLFAGPRE